MPITELVDESTTKKSLRLAVPAERTREIEAQVIGEIRHHAKIPGFRPGHVPERVVRQRFADQIRKEVIDHLLPESLFAAMDEKGLKPVVSPRVGEIEYESGSELKFQATVEVRPPIELAEYRGLPVPKPSLEPTDAEVDQSLTGLAERLAQFVPIEGRSSARGDFLLLDVVGSFPDGDGEDFHDEKIMVELGAEGNLAEINDLAAGRNPGESFEFDRTVEASEGHSKKTHYRVTVVEIKEKQVPPIDDELAKLTGLGENLAEVREEVRSRLRPRKEQAVKDIQRKAILDRLREMHRFDLPEGMVEEATDRALSSFMHDLAHQGVDVAKAELDWTKLRGEARPSAETRVAERLLLDAIGERENIAVTDTELQAEIGRMAKSLEKTPAALRAELEEQGTIGNLRDAIARDRVLEMLIAAAVPTT